MLKAPTQVAAPIHAQSGAPLHAGGLATQWSIGPAFEMFFTQACPAPHCAQSAMVAHSVAGTHEVQHPFFTPGVSPGGHCGGTASHSTLL